MNIHISFMSEISMMNELLQHFCQYQASEELLSFFFHSSVMFNHYLAILCNKFVSPFCYWLFINMKWFMHTGAGLYIADTVQLNRDLNFTSC